MTTPPRIWPRVALFAALVLVVTATAYFFGLTDVDRVRSWIDGAGLAGPSLFVLVFAVLTLSFVPKSAAGAAAGLLFGFGTGLAVTVAGAVLGGSAAFWLARLLGREAVERWTGARMERIDALLRRRGFTGVFVIRLVPVVPFAVVSYGSGLSAVGFLPFVAGTLLGTLPGSSVQVAVGAYGANPWSWQFAAALGALLLLTGVTALVARRLRRKNGL